MTVTTREGQELCIGDVVQISDYYQPGIYWNGLVTAEWTIIDAEFKRYTVDNPYLFERIPDNSFITTLYRTR